MYKSFQFPLAFLAIYFALQIMYLTTPEWIVKGILVEKITVQPSAMLLNWWFSNLPIRAEGSSILSPLGNINVERGCEGTETLLMLIAAILATWRHWKPAVVGLMAGAALIFCVNQLRIMALFWVVLRHPAWFDLAHGYLAPMMVVSAATIFFVFWAKHTLPS